MRNYEDVLRQMQAAGLVVDRLNIGPTPSGKPWRCKVKDDKEKRGWYVVHELPGNDGKSVLVGSYGIWQGNEANAVKIEIGKDTTMSAEQAAALRARLREDKKRAEAMQAAAEAKAARRAEAMWLKLSPTGDAEYLRAKGVGSHGLRFAPSGAAAFPLLDTAGKIHGLQIIRTAAQARQRKCEPKEMWPYGMAKKGHFFLIGMPQHLVLVVEGYATGASVHEATGLPVAVAIDAGNIAPVVAALRAKYKAAKILVCADDDAGGKCRACGERLWLPEHPTTCPHCGAEHRASNAGVSAASATAIAVSDCAWVAPVFATDARRTAYLERGDKITDFNDLHQAEGLHVVRAQIEGQLSALGWSRVVPAQRGAPPPEGGGDAPLRPIQSVEEMLKRYVLVYAQGGTVFDRQEHILLSLSDMRDACIRRDLHRAWVEHPEREIARVSQVDFDPSERKPGITCNLWAGWPTKPAKGNCDRLLEMLWHMCSGEGKASNALYEWVCRWLAYPIQRPGAKMKTCIVVHGPQGTGKNLFFEAYMSVFGAYGRMLDQSALEDKFNDWASRKLFLLADEVVARTEVYHLKNKLKSLITGDRVRINPKNMAAYEEDNHANFVFLSNEAMPVVLEEDDRRHAVIWTPGKLGSEFYAALVEEIRTGGAAALHYYLLQYPLGDFHVGTPPPMTAAKSDLIGLGLDTPMRWYDELVAGEIDMTPRPALTLEWYEAYTIWCRRTGARAAPCSKFVHALARRRGVATKRCFYVTAQTRRGPHMFLMIGGLGEPDGKTQETVLGDHVVAFRRDLESYKGET